MDLILIKPLAAKCSGQQVSLNLNEKQEYSHCDIFDIKIITAIIIIIIQVLSLTLILLLLLLLLLCRTYKAYIMTFSVQRKYPHSDVLHGWMREGYLSYVSKEHQDIQHFIISIIMILI